MFVQNLSEPEAPKNYSKKLLASFLNQGQTRTVETTTDKTGKDKHAGYYCILLSKCLLLVLLENSPGGKNPKVKLSFFL